MVLINKMFENNVIKLIIISYLISLVTGCGLVDRYLNNNKYSEYYAREDEKQKRELIEKHQDCIGMTKEEIQKKYGKPKDLEYNGKHFIKEEWRYENFEERWGYPFNTGIKYIHGNIWWIYFYFKDNKVVKVNTR